MACFAKATAHAWRSGHIRGQHSHIRTANHRKPRPEIHLANAPGGTSDDSHLALRLHEKTRLQLQITYK